MIRGASIVILFFTFDCLLDKLEIESLRHIQSWVAEVSIAKVEVFGAETWCRSFDIWIWCLGCTV